MHVDAVGSGIHISTLHEGWAKLPAWMRRAMHSAAALAAYSGFRDSVWAD